MPTYLGKVRRVEFDWTSFPETSLHTPQGLGVTIEFFWRLNNVSVESKGFTVYWLQSGSVSEVEVFSRFKKLLRDAENRCKPPHLMRWTDAINTPEIRLARIDLMRMDSWNKMMLLPHSILYSERPNPRSEEGKEAKARVMGDAVWKIEANFSNEESDVLLNEIMRREAANEERFGSLNEQMAFVHRSSLSNRPSIPEQVRFEVWRRDQGRCVRCGSQNSLEYDHIIPVKLGGSHSARNLQLLCMACNRSKGPTLGWNQPEGFNK